MIYLSAALALALIVLGFRYRRVRKDLDYYKRQAVRQHERAMESEEKRENLIRRVREIEIEVAATDIEQERAAGGARTLWKRKVQEAEKRLVRQLVQEGLIMVEVRDDPDWMARRCQIRLRALAPPNRASVSHKDLQAVVLTRAGIYRTEGHLPNEPDEPLDPEDLESGMGDRQALD